MLVTEGNGAAGNLGLAMDSSSHPAMPGYQQSAPIASSGYYLKIFLFRDVFILI